MKEPIKFYKQGNVPDCFPVALMNACAMRGVEIPDRKELIKAAGCEHGATISPEKAIVLCSLDFEETTNKEVLKAGEGILTIMHPNYNLHCCYCCYCCAESIYTKRPSNGILLVNSLLNSTEKCLVHKDEIPFPDQPHLNRGWIIKGG